TTMGREPPADDRGDLLLERVDSRIRMRPQETERLRIKTAGQRADFVEFQQPRTPGNEKPDSQLNRRDMVDQIEACDRVEQIAIILERHPGMKGHEGWHEGQVGLAAA